MTPEQQRALILARARRRRAEAEGAAGNGGASHPEFDPRNVPVREAPAPSRLSAGLSSFVEGIPIAGPYIQSGVENAAAGIGSLISGKPQADVREQMGELVDEAQETYPWTSMGAGAAGALAGTLPAMMAAPGLFGLGSGSLLTNTAMSGLSGGVIGAADSAARSDGDLRSTVRGGLAGAAVGAAGPAIGKAIGAGAQAIRDSRAMARASKLAGAPKAAMSRIAKALKADNIPASEIPERLAKLGDDALVLDIGPNLRTEAGGIASLPGRGQEILRSTLEARDAGANRRILQAIDDTLGPTPVPSRVEASIKANQTRLSPDYEAVFKNASPVDTADIAKFLDREIKTLRGDAQRGLTSIRSMLNRVGTDKLESNPRVLLETRKAIDGMLETAKDSNVMNALTTARQAIDDQLRVTVPGIKRVDAKYHELARQNEALKRGSQVLDSGKTTPRPAEMADEVIEGVTPHGELVGPSGATFRLSQGTRAEIDRIVGTKANDRVGLQGAIKGDGSWNRQKLAELYGPEKAQRIIDLVDRERLFADTSHQVIRNSESARRIAAQRELSGRGDEGFGVVDSFKAGGVRGGTRAAALKGVERVWEALTEASRQTRNAGIAEALAGGKQQDVVKALMSVEGIPQIDRAYADRLARALLIGGGTAAARP